VTVTRQLPTLGVQGPKRPGEGGPRGEGGLVAASEQPAAVPFVLQINHTQSTLRGFQDASDFRAELSLGLLPAHCSLHPVSTIAFVCVCWKGNRQGGPVRVQIR